jgi:hypothetical protein
VQTDRLLTDVPAQTLNAPKTPQVKRGFYSTFRSAIGVAVGIAARLASGLAFYAAIPLYLSHLGVDQFSYIAFYQTLLVLASLLDGGLAPVVSSHVARYNQSRSEFSGSSNVVAAGERLGNSRSNCDLCSGYSDGTFAVGRTCGRPRTVR